MNTNRANLQNSLNWQFQDASLLDLALTHSSWANESGRSDQHNERLEFLGDAVLELCVSSELYRRFPKAREGELTRLRSELVSEGSLADIARKLELDKYIKLGKGEEQQGGRGRNSTLSDAVEALIAAVYEDGGFAAAQGAAAAIFSGIWPKEVGEPQQTDSKTRLQEICQREFGECPIYSLLGASGPDHAKIYEIVLTLPNGEKFLAVNTSCKKAEQDAAREALESLKK